MIGLFILVIVILLISGVNNNYIKYDKLYISEVVPKNTYTLKDNYGSYSDYIELYNGYNHDVDLYPCSGCFLRPGHFRTDRAYKRNC